MPGWLINLFIGIAFSWVSWLLRPKPEPPKAATIDDFNIPITKQGQEIPVIYGTVWLKATQVHWYGDFGQRAIRTTQGKKG